jgi:hypothetical protein
MPPCSLRGDDPDSRPAIEKFGAKMRACEVIKSCVVRRSILALKKLCDVETTAYNLLVQEGVHTINILGR